MNNNLPEAFIFMKVGNHAGENFDDILKRKNREHERAGCIFWGYGGTACHPLMQIQPFARLYIRRQGNIYLFMDQIDSKANPDLEPAKEYSENGGTWHSLPEGITVTGSRYALVLDEIETTDLEIDLKNYIVGIGHSRGKSAVEYLRGRIDKGCFTVAPPPTSHGNNSLKKSIKLSARLLEPYAVLLR